MTITLITLIVAVIILMGCLFKLKGDVRVLQFHYKELRSVSGFLRQDVDYASGDIINLTDRLDKLEKKNFIEKTTYSDEVKNLSVDMMVKDGLSTREASAKLGIPQRTLAGWLKKYNEQNKKK